MTSLFDNRPQFISTTQSRILEIWCRPESGRVFAHVFANTNTRDAISVATALLEDCVLWVEDRVPSRFWLLHAGFHVTGPDVETLKAFCSIHKIEIRDKRSESCPTKQNKPDGFIHMTVRQAE